MDNKQKLRKGILKLHYDISEGNSWNLVLRHEVAKRSGFGNDYNNKQLIGAIKYLEDKGFLKASTNVEDQITTQGIDEVEENFPTFSNDKNEKDDIKNVNIEKLFKLLSKISWAYEKGEKEILENKKLEEIEEEIKKDIKEIINDLGEDEQLKYKKMTTGWKKELKPGFCNKRNAEEKLESWKEFIEETIEKLTGYEPRAEVYLSEFQTYEAVKTLRSILRSAEAKVWIIDNFLHPEFLSILEPYIRDKNLDIRILTKSKNNSNFNSFCVDFAKLKKQYPNTLLEARDNFKAHDRYLIIDEKSVYHSGHSLHDLGEKSSQINKVESEEVMDNIKSDFSKWWQNGNIIS